MAKQLQAVCTRFRNNSSKTSTDRNETKDLRNQKMVQILSKQLRVAVMGPEGVGKTSIVDCLQKCLNGETMNATCNSQANRNEPCMVQIMDSESSMTPFFRDLFIRTANAFLLIYDVSDKDSFELISAMRRYIVELKGSDNIPMIVLGNKLDKGEREVHPVIADCVVTMDWEALHAEISANDASRLCEIFEDFQRLPAVVDMQKRYI